MKSVNPRFSRTGLRTRVLFFAALLLSATMAPAQDKKPNIVVIFGDDIGMWNVGAYTHGMMGNTPNIDSIAKNGMLFTDHYGQPSCTAGRAAFIMGQLPVRTGETTVGIPGSTRGIQKEDPTLAEVLKTLGMTGLNLLMLTLCVTPIRRATGLNSLIKLRRMLGLFSFFYLSLHFLTYIGLYIEFDWRNLLEDIGKRPYITVGFTALMLMVPLAVTSTNGWQRRLGRRWVKLHRLVYAIAILAVVHYWWQVKLDVSDPLLYVVLLAGLFAARIAHWRALERKRGSSVDAKAAVPPTYQRVEPP